MRWGTVVAVVVALSLALAGTASSAQPVAHAACGGGDTSATIGGRHKCLGPGEYCKRGAEYEREYEYYGFECRRKNGEYRLRRSR